MQNAITQFAHIPPIQSSTDNQSAGWGGLWGVGQRIFFSKGPKTLEQNIFLIKRNKKETFFFNFASFSSLSSWVYLLFLIKEKRKNKMPEGITAENLLNNIMDTLSDGGPKHKSASFFQDESESSVSAQFNRLFGRQKPIHHCLGGGKTADSMLWRNKKISAGVLISATAIWVLFEWLNYNFLSLVCFGLSFGLIAQFLLKNASGVINRSPSNVSRFVLPDDLFINIAKTIGAEINHGLGFLQDAALGGNLKQFGVVILSLWVAGMIGSWCNFLTVLYIGFVSAHTLPVLYEKYEDEVDGFVHNALEKLQGHYKKLDSGVLSRIPRGSFRGKKHE